MLKIADNKIADVDELKTHLIDEWAQFGRSLVDAAMSQWRVDYKHSFPCTRGTLSINCVNFENDCFTNL